MVNIWGESLPNREIKLNCEWGEELILQSENNGKWAGKLKTPEAGGPFLITLKSGNEIIKINDVLIGEVWLASGQSNMDMPVKGWPPNDPIDNSDYEISNANFPMIRMFNVEKVFTKNPSKKIQGQWNPASPEFVGNFSATAYFFACEIYKKLDIPVGIIHSSWGGSPAEAWTSKLKLNNLGLFSETMDIFNKGASEIDIKNWFKKFPSINIPKQKYPNDLLKIEFNELQFSVDDLSQYVIDDQSWEEHILPGRFDDLISSQFDGAFWFRKLVFIDDISQDYILSMGYVDDMDKTYINGNFVGGLSGFGVAHTEREYKIPKSYLNKGNNLIAIRAIDTGGPGFFKGPMQLSNKLGSVISIEGKWKYQPIAEMYDGKYFIYEIGADISDRISFLKLNPFLPTVLFNGMINPIIPFSIKGVIWYQGESNVGRAEQYEKLFPGMIADWRNRWNIEFPFYYAQIAPYRYNKDPKMHVSQKLRDAQRKTLNLSKTGMAVTLDIGDFDNIHPSNKQEVGNRLARLALNNEYGFELIPSGPILKSARVIKNLIKIEFEHVGSGLVNQKAKINQFEIASDDRQFFEANVLLKEKYIYVSSDIVKNPKYVRYAWSDTPEASLFNSEGLPASSFMIDVK